MKIEELVEAVQNNWDEIVANMGSEGIKNFESLLYAIKELDEDTTAKLLAIMFMSEGVEL